METFLGRELLYLACRHHQHEVFAGRIYLGLMGGTRGPDDVLSHRFQARWNQESSFNRKAYVVPVDIEWNTTALEAISVESTRGDYHELLDLALLITGSLNCSGKVAPPGAHHHARWMSKLIYAFKMILYRDQFELSIKDYGNLVLFCQFVVETYIPAWFGSLVPRFAPLNDLNLFKAIYAAAPSVRKHGIPAVQGQAWYLHPTMVALAFFDERIPSSTKRTMVRNLGRELPRGKVAAKRMAVLPTDIANTSIADFIYAPTMNFFNILNLCTDFLLLDPDDWETDESYIIARKVVGELNVLNDCAERAIALDKRVQGRTYKEDLHQGMMHAIKRSCRNRKYRKAA